MESGFRRRTCAGGQRRAEPWAASEHLLGFNWRCDGRQATPGRQCERPPRRASAMELTTTARSLGRSPSGWLAQQRLCQTTDDRRTGHTSSRSISISLKSRLCSRCRCLPPSCSRSTTGSSWSVRIRPVSLPKLCRCRKIASEPFKRLQLSSQAEALTLSTTKSSTRLHFRVVGRLSSLLSSVNFDPQS